MRKSTLGILTALLLVAGLVYTQSRLRVGDLRHSVAASFKSPQAMLSPDVVRILAGEFAGILANYMLLEVGSFVGSNVKPSENDYQNIYRALKLSLALDPHFQQTYLVTQGYLPWRAKMVDEAIELLHISRENRPWDWRPGHYIGFNHYYFKSDFSQASEILLETAKIKGAPVVLAILGGRFAAKGQRTEAAIVMLREMLKDEELPESYRLEIEERLAALSGVFLLETAVGRYHDVNGNYPSDLQELVNQGIISALPANPYGDHYFYNPQTGGVTFDNVKEVVSNQSKKKDMKNVEYTPFPRWIELMLNY